MMIPVQEITLRTKNGRRFQVYIENPGKSIYEIRIYFLDPIEGSIFYPPDKQQYQSAEQAYEEMLKLILPYLDRKNDGDSIEDADNPCNCELIDRTSQIDIISKFGKSFPVKVNGKT